ncbi:peptide ABC transporter substrate-binding protein [Paenibacillus mucilaginosus]|uniref:DppE n=1 Tax=Paenibacillus mucilaginosus (strain KNP414) TaxID=1036673 RepID=F8FLL2_PAEMK|nr:peptide ABC transporter substrate-binding protein [Paenibacillus mucilaginosus]AEI44139.1 DppE [Paenibacillus mucilaginosus KNP414]MCG7212390.1 peptide ABC transporter substrate-binding protein [Paenibacillus mucilaginosus]WDM25568.1 peptide ABC transporter substrate-binding protein [Paenibacillus mucilaginosus]
MKSLSILLVSCCLMLGTLLSGCSPEASTPQGDAAKKETAAKILMYNNVREPTSLDPPVGFDMASYDILNNMMEGLTRLGKNQTPEPAMAREWKISPDGRTVTFLLREGIKWSNGDPVKASDFEFAWKKLLDPKQPSQAAPLAYVIEGGEAFHAGRGTADGVRVKAVDDKTLQVTLTRPASWLISMAANPAFFPVHRATVEKNPKWAAEAATILSNGPFKLAEWKHDAELKLVRNEHYWDAANVKLDGVTFKMVNDSNTEYQLFQSGELHISMVPPDLSEKLFAENKARVEDSAGTYFYRFNTKMPPFDNASIRRAFLLAVDSQKIVDLVTKQKQKPAAGFVSYGLKGPDGRDFRESGGRLVTFDAAEARKLLAKGMAEAGYAKLPEVTLTYNTNDLHQKIAQTLQAMFKENLGVDVKLANKESKVLTAEQKALQLQMSRSSFLPDFADPINFLDGYQTGNPMNRTGWSSAKYDGLIQSAYKETDEKKRFALLHEAEKLLIEEAPILPIYFYSSTYLQSDKVTDIVRHTYGYIDFKWADMK